MDKKGAIERLDAIEKEAEELRKIIKRSDKIEYDEMKMYVAVYHSYAYMLCGSRNEGYFRWHTFKNYPTEEGKTRAAKTGQEAINDMIYSEGDVHTFSDPKEGMKFFYEKYLELNV
jgi:hypothetical protein